MAARQVSGSPAAYKQSVAPGPLTTKGNPAKTNPNSQSGSSAGTSGETESDSVGDSPPEQAFDDLIQQIASQAKPPAGQGLQAQAQAPTADLSFYRVWQTAGGGATAVVPSAQTLTDNVPAVMTTAAAVPVQANDKKPPANSSRSASATPAPAKDHTLDTPPGGVIVVAPPPPVKAKLADLTSAGGGVPEIQPKLQPLHIVPPKPEAALTVVISTADQTSGPAPSANEPAPVQEAEYAGNQPEFVAAATDAANPDNTAASASAPLASTAQISTAAQLSSYEAVTPIGASAARAEAEPRKTIAGESSIATPDTGTVRSASAQTAAFQDLQLKAEPAKTDNAASRNEPPKAPAAATPQSAAEKAPAQPVKSVALEFTPDGARDVKVRLSERGGEVHVSVHSTDPSVTKNLRAGVTDLASVLEHAGYDAKTWAGGRQQQENPQQQQQETPQRRNSRTALATEQFDNILQQPNQENS